MVQSLRVVDRLALSCSSLVSTTHMTPQAKKMPQLLLRQSVHTRNVLDLLTDKAIDASLFAY